MITNKIIPVRSFKTATLFFAFCSLFSNAAFARGTMSYTVPKSGALTEDVTIELQRARFRIDLGTATLDYELPMELDGTRPHRFVLTGAFVSGVWKMSTEDGSVNSECTGTAKNFSCRMVYDKNEDGIFPLDVASANSYLETRIDLTPAQIEKFQLAQSVLSHEPIGIVRGRKR